MDINIIDELTKKLQEGKQKEMSLSERLKYLDNYNKDVANPILSREKPKGYDPMNTLNAFFNQISDRKAVSQDVSSQSNSNLDLLNSIATIQKQNAPAKIDPIELLKLELDAKSKGLTIDTKNLTVGSDTTKPKATKDVLDVVNKLMSRKTGEISGLPNIKAFIPGTDTQLTKNYFDQLKSMLSLENRSKLKGSGAISDYEAKTLDKAASALGRNLSDADFKKVLEDLQKGLSGEEDVQVGDYTIKEIK